ncbi:MAG: MATE family efflux transporter [Clostridia bacterium]|nr:MATE family efflux transporter [Clostridia bacterium]
MKAGFLSLNTSRRRDIILSGPILSTVMLLSVPTLMMGLVQSVMPLIDGLFINNLAGTVAASSVTYCTPVIAMVAAAAQGLGAASMAMIGQMNGRGEYSNAKYIATQVIVSGFLLGCLLAPFLLIIAFPISSHVNYEISSDVFTYLALNSLVLPFTFLEAVYNGIKNSSGKPEATFYRMLLLLLLKFVFNFLFIDIISLGVVGAALSSLFANLFISVWMYFELFLKISDDKLELRGFRFDVDVLRELFHIGMPSMLTSLMVNLGFFLINNEVEKYGAPTLNGQGIASSITSVCFILPSSFGAAVTTMVSMNIGAGNGKKALKCCIAGCAVSSVAAAALIATVVPLSPYLTVLFTRQPDVLAVANRALHIYTYSVIGFGICAVEISAFIGLGRTVLPLIVGVMRIWLLRYVFILLTERFLGVDSVFWGNLFSNYAAAAITTFMLMRVPWVSALPLTKKVQKSDR